MSDTDLWLADVSPVNGLQSGGDGHGLGDLSGPHALHPGALKHEDFDLHFSAQSAYSDPIMLGEHFGSGDSLAFMSIGAGLDAQQQASLKRQAQEPADQPRSRDGQSEGKGDGSAGCPRKCIKLDREKLRRDKLNEQFMELASILEPGRPPKSDKASILVDSVAVVSKLRNEVDRLRTEHTALLQESRELTTEKSELREEKNTLKQQKDDLGTRARAMFSWLNVDPPSLMALPQHTPPASTEAQTNHPSQEPQPAPSQPTDAKLADEPSNPNTDLPAQRGPSTPATPSAQPQAPQPHPPFDFPRMPFMHPYGMMGMPTYSPLFPPQQHADSTAARPPAHFPYPTHPYMMPTPHPGFGAPMLGTYPYPYPPHLPYPVLPGFPLPGPYPSASLPRPVAVVARGPEQAIPAASSSQNQTVRHSSPTCKGQGRSSSVGRSGLKSSRSASKLDKQSVDNRGQGDTRRCHEQSPSRLRQAAQRTQSNTHLHGSAFVSPGQAAGARGIGDLGSRQGQNQTRTSVVQGASDMPPAHDPSIRPPAA